MKKHVFIALISLFSITCCVAYAGDTWSTWRGDDMSGIAAGEKPPVKWSETENVKWKVALEGDKSNSSPIVYNDKIIYMAAVSAGSNNTAATPAAGAQPARGRRGGGFGGFGGFGRGGNTSIGPFDFKVVCRDLNTGDVIWKKTMKTATPHEGHHADHGYASYSPVTDGKLIWADFGSRGLYCLDFDGNVKWEKDLGKLTMRAGFGEGNSPILVDDMLIVVHDQEGDSKIWAFDKTTGDVKWEKARNEATAWTSPIVVEADGTKQIVVIGHNKTIAYGLDGEIIWTCGGMTQNVIPTPVFNDEMVFCTTGFMGAKLQGIKLADAKGDITGKDAVVWEVNEGAPYVPSPVYYEDKVYIISVNTNVISCYKAKDGALCYKNQKLNDINGIYSSPMAANGNVYFTGRNGVTYVLKNSDTYETVSINKLNDDVDCSFAVIKNMILIKGKKNLYCIAEEK